jgi:hypothetical protein
MRVFTRADTFNSLCAQPVRLCIAGLRPPIELIRNGGAMAPESRGRRNALFRRGRDPLWRKELPQGEETQIAALLFRYNVAVAEHGVDYNPYREKSRVIPMETFRWRA